jgi:hypothetical protein
MSVGWISLAPHRFQKDSEVRNTKIRTKLENMFVSNAYYTLNSFKGDTENSVPTFKKSRSPVLHVAKILVA